MTELQETISLLIIIISLNVVISFLYGKFLILEPKEKKTFDFGNHSTFVSVGTKFGPRVPFLILRAARTNKAKKIKIIHNALCILVYTAFIFCIISMKD